jgi:hypothetical protein
MKEQRQPMEGTNYQDNSSITIRQDEIFPESLERGPNVMDV